MGETVHKSKIQHGTRELCKRCWRFSPIGFDVPDQMWRRAVPKDFRNRVLCIMCFDYFATEAGVDWVEAVNLYPVSGMMLRRIRSSLMNADGDHRPRE